MIDSTQKYLPFPLFLMSLVIVGGGMWYILRITNTPIPQPISINEVAVTTDQESSLFGDINKDKGVNLLDYNIFVSEFGKSGYSSADLDKSGQVNLIDFTLFGEASGTTTLTLSPGAISTVPGTESTLILSINTGVSHVTGAKVEIIYEPNKIGTPVVTLGSFLPNVFVSPKIENGKIIFTLAAPPSSGGVIGSGTLATIKIKPTVVGTSSLSFGESNAVFAIGGQTNVLKLASDATITITDPNIK